jgi:hypothetical protein
MSRLKMVLCVAAGTLLLAAQSFAQTDGQQGQGRVVVTVMPKHAGDAPVTISQQDLKLAVSGRASSVTGWEPLRGPEDSLELVVLIDNSARTTLGKQLDDIEHFIEGLPPNAKSVIGYMDYGRAGLTGPLSADHAEVLRGLRMPQGVAHSIGGAYVCLSDLAKNWPSRDAKARREVVIVSDGIGGLSSGFMQTDPYLQAAINDSVRAGLVVYSIFWGNRVGSDRPSIAAVAGQGLLNQLSEATGGNSYQMGNGNPVSFQPYFKDLTRRLQNQYRLSFAAGLKNEPEIASLKLKIKVPGTEIDSPTQVFVERAAPAMN